jgi:hypothetical protein
MMKFNADMNKRQYQMKSVFVVRITRTLKKRRFRNLKIFSYRKRNPR